MQVAIKMEGAPGGGSRIVIAIVLKGGKYQALPSLSVRLGHSAFRSILCRNGRSQSFRRGGRGQPDGSTMQLAT